MIDQYVKLFNIDWIDAWLVEAIATIFGALIVALLIAKFMDTMNGDQQ